MNSSLSRGALGLGLLLLVAGGCEERITRASPPSETEGDDGRAAASKEEDAGLPSLEPQDLDFTENSRSRDPFRPYSELLAAEAREQFKSQRSVVLEQYSVDDLKLAGIVGRIPDSRALMVDPSGKGHTVKRGQFIGRAETVRAAGVDGTTYDLNWRIDRIRENDVVLVREDPKNPDVPSETRVIPLRDPSELSQLELLEGAPSN